MKWIVWTCSLLGILGHILCIAGGSSVRCAVGGWEVIVCDSLYILATERYQCGAYSMGVVEVHSFTL